MAEKRQFNVYLSTSLIRRVRLAALSHEASLSAFVERALTGWLEPIGPGRRGQPHRHRRPWRPRHWSDHRRSDKGVARVENPRLGYGTIDKILRGYRSDHRVPQRSSVDHANKRGDARSPPRNRRPVRRQETRWPLDGKPCSAPSFHRGTPSPGHRGRGHRACRNRHRDDLRQFLSVSATKRSQSRANAFYAAVRTFTR